MKQTIAVLSMLMAPIAGIAAEPLANTEAARQLLGQFFPGLQIDDIRKAPLPGYYEVAVGSRVLYLSEDGRYMLLGDVVNTKTKTNVTEQRRAELIKDKISGVTTDQMIVMGNKDSKRHVTVFTDVDCPYCAKFHRDVPKLNAAGLEVRYLLFPRTGVASRSYYRAVGVWCAKDRIEAIGIAKAGGEVELKKCDNPVKQHMDVGVEVGINGTPAIVLDDGYMIPGYVPPKELLGRVGLGSQNP